MEAEISFLAGSLQKIITHIFLYFNSLASAFKIYDVSGKNYERNINIRGKVFKLFAFVQPSIQLVSVRDLMSSAGVPLLFSLSSEQVNGNI